MSCGLDKQSRARATYSRLQKIVAVHLLVERGVYSKANIVSRMQYRFNSFSPHLFDRIVQDLRRAYDAPIVWCSKKRVYKYSKEFDLKSIILQDLGFNS